MMRVFCDSEWSTCRNLCIEDSSTKSASRNRYFTYPGMKEEGVAIRMVQELLKIAQAGNQSMRITAQTLPQINASTTVLRNLGFTKTGSTVHSEDGEVWEWSRETR